MTAARPRVATGTAGGAGGPCEAVGFGVLPAGHQPRGERGAGRRRGRRGGCGAGLPAGHDGVSSRTFARCARGDSTTSRRRLLRAGSWSRRADGSCRHHGHDDGPHANLRPRKSTMWTGKCSHAGKGCVLTRRKGANDAGWTAARPDGGAGVPGTQRTPRTPTRAHLPLLPSGPGGVRRDDAARGVCTQPSPGRRRARNPLHRAPDRRLPGGDSVGAPRSGILVALLSVRIRASPTVARRIRLVAYGARLESVLG